MDPDYIKQLMNQANQDQDSRSACVRDLIQDRIMENGTNFVGYDIPAGIHDVQTIKAIEEGFQDAIEHFDLTPLSPLFLSTEAGHLRFWQLVKHNETGA